MKGAIASERRLDDGGEQVRVVEVHTDGKGNWIVYAQRTADDDVEMHTGAGGSTGTTAEAGRARPDDLGVETSDSAEVVALALEATASRPGSDSYCALL